ncbi:hypothetical protein OPQ81_002483 [Rhizoctonia solani]|nr:hypothetical protein OPQ81_002483 [Rhizoctonia solani]
MATKTLNFYAYGLQKDTTVMLMFEPPNSHKLFKDQFPVRSLLSAPRDMPRLPSNTALASLFGYAQTDQDNLVDSAAWVESGDIGSISGGPGQKRFGENSKGNGSKLLVCKNNTDGRANLSIEFVKGDGIHQCFEPTLVWTGVGPVHAQPHRIRYSRLQSY